MIRPFDGSRHHARCGDGIAHYDGRPASLVEMLRATVEKTPQAEAIVEVGGERVTYRQLWERAARVAGGLRRLGIRAGDRVAIRLPNGLDWCLAFFGAQMAGAVVVPVNTRFSEPEVAYVISDSGAAFTFLPGMQGNALPDGPPFVTDTLDPRRMSPPSSIPAAPPASPKAP
jgi:long-chain acyl-CoA synthetase